MTAPEVKVTQADRDAGAEFWAFLGQHGSADQCRNGKGFRATAEQFARHRATATAPLEARIALLEGAMGEAVGAIEKIAEHRPMFDYVSGPGWDQPGSPYDRGRQDEARFLADTARNTLASLRAMLADDGETK